MCGPVSNRGEILLADGAREPVNTGKDRVTTLRPMDSDGNLELLMARYQEGDTAAASALIDRLSPRLYRFFAAQLDSRADADDLLQETWLRIHRVRHTYRPGQPVLP